MGDPELFPGTKKLEQRVIRMVAALLHAPSTYGGKFLSGGTESNIIALHLARSLSKKKEIVIPQSAHFSFKKASSLLELKLRVVPTKGYRMDVHKVQKFLGNNTACVIAVAGTTGLGMIDPIPDIADICYDENIFFHVDAAFGGFIIPFLQKLGYPLPAFDFTLPGVSSVSLDPHKMGCSVIPSGLLFIRENKWFEAISVSSPYISTKRQSSIVGTRPGASVAATYAVMRHLGQEGYIDIAKKCMDLTHYTQHSLKKSGFLLVTDPVLNVIGICVKNPARVAKKLMGKGWMIGYDAQLGCLRLVIMPHVKKRLINSFITDLLDVVEC
jgi:tyrosine decarboxylase/aspartate 1-decarboxylase